MKIGNCVNLVSLGLGPSRAWSVSPYQRVESMLFHPYWIQLNISVLNLIMRKKSWNYFVRLANYWPAETVPSTPLRKSVILLTNSSASFLNLATFSGHGGPLKLEFKIQLLPPVSLLSSHLLSAYLNGWGAESSWLVPPEAIIRAILVTCILGISLFLQETLVFASGQCDLHYTVCKLTTFGGDSYVVLSNLAAVALLTPRGGSGVSCRDWTRPLTRSRRVIDRCFQLADAAVDFSVLCTVCKFIDLNINNSVRSKQDKKTNLEHQFSMIKWHVLVYCYLS